MYTKKLQEMKQYFQEGKTLNIESRVGVLKKLKSTIKKYESDLIEALANDLGKSEFEAYASEIGFVLSTLSRYIKNLKKWTKNKKVKTPYWQPFSKSMIQYEPYGLVLLIGPYNYPFQLVFEPLIGAVSAGNTVVLKPSEYSVHTNAVIQKIITDTFDTNHVTLIEGAKEEVQELLKYRFDYIFFTGSPRVGKIVAQKAASMLVPYTLELGGKSPTIVHKDADIDIAARRIVWGKFLNAGQTCIAPDFICVHEDIKEKLVEKMIEYIKKFYSENPEESSDYGRLVHDIHYKHILELLNGHNVLYGGRHNKDTHFVEPTLLGDITFKSEIMQVEIFGPLLPFITYSDINDLIKTLQQREKPLALYVFTKSKDVSNKVLQTLSYGGGCVNDTISHITNTNLPFGGVGNSGSGKYHGRESFIAFSHRKSILFKPNWFDLKMIYPPYKNNVKIIRRIFK